MKHTALLGAYNIGCVHKFMQAIEMLVQVGGIVLFQVVSRLQKLPGDFLGEDIFCSCR